MDLDKTSPEKAAKNNLWNTVRLIFYIMKKHIGNSKLIVLDLNTLLKRGKIASKAMTKLLTLHHRHSYYSALTCRSQDDVVHNHRSFISPREYEFSCRDTPLFNTSSKRKQHYIKNKEEDAKLMQKVLDILHRYDVVEATSAASPMLPGFGQSPVTRQLRVSDSPFLLKDAEEDDETMKISNGRCYQVDKDAEDFINKFYKDLKNQKRVAALDSPSPYHMWAR